MQHLERRSLGERSLPAKKMVPVECVSTTPLSAMTRWKIINEKEARKLQVEIVNGGLLQINLKHLPPYMTIEDFVRHIQDNSIVYRYND